MPKNRYEIRTAPFTCQGRKQFVTVEEHPRGEVVRRRLHSTHEVVEETISRTTPAGCAIEEIAVSPSGTWLVTNRFSGQGEWGYDVLQTCPLKRKGGVTEDKEEGYMLDMPRFSADESCLVGGFGADWIGGWWAHPDDDPDEPARGGRVTFGFLFVHQLPSQRVKRHELRMDIPAGYLPKDPEGSKWFGATDIKPVKNGIQLILPGKIKYTISYPLRPVILLPTPHPAGRRLLS